MRPSGRAVVIAVIAGSLAALAVLDIYAPRDGLPRFTPGAPLDSPEAGDPGSSGARRPAGGTGATGFPVSYKLHDLEEKEREISCTIDGKSYRKAVDSFGAPSDQKKIWKELDKRFDSYVRREVRRLGLNEYLKLTVSSRQGKVWKGEVTGTWEIPKGFPEPKKAEIRRKVQEFDKWLDALRKDDKAEEIAKDYYREKGFVRGKNGILEIDYVNLAIGGTDALQPCFQSLTREAGEDKFHQLFFLTSLLQEMPFDPTPPMVESGILKAEFRVPADVMVSNKGDCDSKSVTFASMWRNHPEPVLLVHEWNGRKGRYHTLVAVEPVPGAGSALLPLGLRRFVLCEVAGTVAGTKKLHPGVRYEPGSYVRYDCVPPAGMEESDFCDLKSPWERMIREFLRGIGLPLSEEPPAPAPLSPPPAPPAQIG